MIFFRIFLFENYLFIEVLVCDCDHFARDESFIWWIFMKFQWAEMLTKHLLNSLPRGNLVDGLPRAANVFDIFQFCFLKIFFIEVLFFDGDHFERNKKYT